MFEYPLINYLPQLIMAAIWFFPGFVLGFFLGFSLGWRAHITFIMAKDGSLQKEGEAQGIKISTAAEEATSAAEEKHKPGEFFW